MMNDEKILYVTDLDGTLLTNGKKISHTSRKIFEPKIPIIIYNGTFILDLKTGEKVLVDSFSHEDVCEIRALLEKHRVHPFVYAMVDGVELFSYVEGTTNSAQEHFLNEHKGDERENPTSADALYAGEVFHFTLMGDEDKLLELNRILSPKFECVYYVEQYSGDWWLEIHPKGASKASALRLLKDMLGAHRVVCFGDGINDTSMFECADECYAVSNACDELKAIATGVIGSNEDDGVAKYLLENIKSNI